MAGSVRVVGSPNRVEHFFESSEPSIGVTVEVVVAALPDTFH
jgi:hypothetical protein